ncbi:transcriptional regulator ATRX homolog [Papaver somniferum]|uniref:transcriptional regulator ATRX homolog n=1 Tax=Papaver somniferum TaxID=3469 RepID=UPI000E701261|nr:transcriptional regulator ATRX homolog [Papaver somniferum]
MFHSMLSHTVVEIEDSDDDAKPTNKKWNLKKYQVVSSDSETDDQEILEVKSGDEDEDIVPISQLFKKSETQLAKESKEGNGCSDSGTFEKLNQDSHVQVSKSEKISEPPKDSLTTATDIEQESNVKAKKKKKRSRGEDGDAKTEQMDLDHVELKPTEGQPGPSAIPSKDLSVPYNGVALGSDVKPKKRNRRNRGEDGGARAKNTDQDCVGAKPEEEQPNDRLESDGTPKKKHGRNHGEDVLAKTKGMNQDLAGVEPEKDQLTGKIINSAGHVSNQDNGEVKRKKKKKKAQKSAENVNYEQDKN